MCKEYVVTAVLSPAALDPTLAMGEHCRSYFGRRKGEL